MSDNPPDDTKVPPSAPAPLTDAQLDAAATITVQDVARSMADARRRDAQLAAMLMARPVNGR